MSDCKFSVAGAVFYTEGEYTVLTHSQGEASRTADISETAVGLEEASSKQVDGACRAQPVSVPKLVLLLHLFVALPCAVAASPLPTASAERFGLWHLQQAR